MSVTKCCIHCYTRKPLEDFPPNRNTCRGCWAIQQARYRSRTLPAKQRMTPEEYRADLTRRVTAVREYRHRKQKGIPSKPHVSRLPKPSVILLPWLPKPTRQDTIPMSFYKRRRLTYDTVKALKRLIAEKLAANPRLAPSDLVADVQKAGITYPDTKKIGREVIAYHMRTMAPRIKEVASPVAGASAINAVLDHIRNDPKLSDEVKRKMIEAYEAHLRTQGQQ